VSRRRAVLLRAPKSPINISRETKSENELILSRYNGISVLLNSKMEGEGKTTFRNILES